MTDELLAKSVAKGLKAAVEAIGGPKEAGAMLFPEKEVDDADGLVNDCINPNRREKFSMLQIVKLLAKARESGCHDAMHAIERAAGYSTSRPSTAKSSVAGEPSVRGGGDTVIPTLLAAMLQELKEIKLCAGGMDDKLEKLSSGVGCD